MWSYHDTKIKELKALYNRTSKQTQKRLQEIFDTYKLSFDELYNIANAKTKKMIDTQIEEWEDKELLKNDFGNKAKDIKNRTRVKNNEILMLLIYGVYIEEQSKLQDKELNILSQDVNYYYKQGQEEVNKTLSKNKRKSLEIPTALLIMLLDRPIIRGYLWKEYIQSTIEYNTEQIYRQSVIDIQQLKDIKIDSDIYQGIIKRQQTSKLNINGDKISGAIDNAIINMNNQAKIEGITSIDNNAKVRFIAVEDNVTTKMCRSLDGQIFNVHDWNEFERYSDTNKTKRKYKCYGLVTGLNLPPIDDHFHYCRSSIVYNTKYTSRDFENGNTLGENQKKFIKRYLKSESYKINEKLYNNIELTDEDKEFINNLDEALKGMPTYKGWVNRSLYVRDTEDVSNILKVFNNEQKIGGWKSYVSSSKGIYDTNFKMIMKIKSKNGKNLSSLNDEGGGEIIFPRNTQFQLLDINSKNGIIYVKLEEV